MERRQGIGTSGSSYSWAHSPEERPSEARVQPRVSQSSTRVQGVAPLLRHRYVQTSLATGQAVRGARLSVVGVLPKGVPSPSNT